MHKNYKSKYSNPNSTDISISTQHIDRKEFSCTISQEKYANKIFQILKNKKKKKKKKKKQRKTQRRSWNEKRCAENAKILEEIRKKKLTT